MKVLRTGALGALALSILLVGGCAGSPSTTDTPIAAPEPLGPRGATEIPFVFAWKPSPGETPVYRVRVTDAAERVLYEQDVRKATCPPSTELKKMMADHSTFMWTVSVLSADGTREVAKSAPVPFSLK